MIVLEQPAQPFPTANRTWQPGLTRSRGREEQEIALALVVPFRMIMSDVLVVRSSKYLNNLIEQDHRRIKQRLRPMLGLKSFETADIVISGIELAEKIKKGQFTMGKLGGPQTNTA